MMRRLGRFVGGAPKWVLAGGILVTALLGWQATKLRLATDLISLLPDGSPAATDYRLFLEKFGGFEKVFVLIEAAGAEQDKETGKIDPEKTAAVMAAAERLAEILAESPLVRDVRTGLEPADVAFFESFVLRRAPLLLPDSALAGIAQKLEPAAVEARAAEIAGSLRSPAGEVRATLLVGDPLGLADQLDLMSAGIGMPMDLLTSTFLTPEGDLSLLMFSPTVAEIDPESGRQMEATLAAAFEQVRQEAGEPLHFHALGGPLYAAQDERLFREDFAYTMPTSAITCVLLLVIVFGSLRIPLASFAGVACGMVATAGLITIFLGELSAVSLGFAAVLVGLGIDYGIHLGSRYRQQVLAGKPPLAAIEDSFAYKGAGLWSSALTTASGFVVLGFAHFRPLREVGLVVGLGIVMMVIGSLTIGASLWYSPAGRERSPAIWRFLERSIHWLVGFAQRRPRPVLIVTVLLTAGGLWGLTGLGLSGDLAALRPTNHPIFKAEELLAKRFGVGLDTSTVVIEGADLEQLLERAGEAKTLLAEATGGRASITSPTDWLIAAPRAEERLRRLAELPFAKAAEVLAAALERHNLSPKAFAPGLDALRAFGRGEDPGAPTREDWPSGLGELIRQEPGGAGEQGKVYAALQLRLPDDLWPEGPPDELAARLREKAPGAAMASAIRIGAELKRLAAEDLRNLSLLALLVVATVVMVSFRGQVAPSALSLAPVLLGACWSLGLCGALGQPLDLLSLTVVPTLLGIGIDNGLHVIHGARSSGNVAEAAKQAGVAMFLNSGATVFSFGSLILSSIPGLRIGGILISAGVIACFFATVLVLPAVAALRGRE
jgi:predicted RND superfamily exporter protein